MRVVTNWATAGAVAILLILASVPPSGHLSAQEGSGQEPSGGLQLTVLATPETANSIVPFVVLDGVDVFATHCAPLDDFALTTAEAVYECLDLELAVYDVGAPPIDGIAQTLNCSPVGAFDDFDPTEADVAADGYVYCTISAYPPGVRVALWHADPATAVDSIVILDETGADVDVACRDSSLFDREPLLHCDPLALGTYTVPDQRVDASGEVRPFSCSVGIGASFGPDDDNTFTLERRHDQFNRDLSVWTCIDEPPPEPETPELTLTIDADPAIVDDLAIELRQDGVDVRSDHCAPEGVPDYLDSGLDGHRSFACRNTWEGEVTPVVVNAPDTHTVTTSCFERNPVSGIIGPSAVFDEDNDVWWICSIVVLEPSILVVSPPGIPSVETLTLASALDSGLAVGSTTLTCRRDERGSASADIEVADCGPLPIGTFEVAPLFAGTAEQVDLDCFAYRSLLSSDPGGGATIVNDGSADNAFWTCVMAEPFLDEDSPGDPGEPGSDGRLPATGPSVSKRLAPLASLLIMLGMALVRAGRRQTISR